MVRPLDLLRNELTELQAALHRVDEKARRSEKWKAENDAKPRYKRSPAQRRKHDGVILGCHRRRTQLLHAIREYHWAIGVLDN